VCATPDICCTELALKKGKAAVIVGAQWGDEGKGKIVDVLSEGFPVVARYAGGHNAGHTVIISGKKFILQLVPCGVLRSGCCSVIGNGVVLDPMAFLKEVGGLREAGVQVDGNLFVSNRAQVILPYHRMIELAAENAPGRVKIGTTSRGIGPAYEDKMGRRGLRVADLLDLKLLKTHIDNAVREKNMIAHALFNSEPLDSDKMYTEYAAAAEKIAPFVCDTAALLNRALTEGKSIVFEGAQGTMLDIDHGTYPFVTSSSATSGGAVIGTGVAPTAIDMVIGVTKAYCTRVGGGPFPAEALNEQGDLLRARGNEYGAVGGHVDASNTWGPLGVRVNAVYGGVDSGIDHTRGHRSLLAAALDYKPIDNLTFTLDAEHILKQVVEPGLFLYKKTPAPTPTNLYPALQLPPLLDPHTNFGPDWASNRAEERNLLVAGNLTLVSGDYAPVLGGTITVQGGTLTSTAAVIPYRRGYFVPATW